MKAYCHTLNYVLNSKNVLATFVVLLYLYSKFYQIIDPLFKTV